MRKLQRSWSSLEGTYILPIRAADASQATELADYFRQLGPLEIIVVDGSPADVFAVHSDRWAQLAVHMPPAGDIPGANGKTRGVLTGLRHAGYEKVIVADDDVRYDRGALRFVLAALDAYGAVLPQNYFSPAPWHAILDTGRTLLNRVTGGDWPGTVGVRKSFLRDGYNADVLFENFEMVRTVEANGALVLRADDCYVLRRPPSAKRYWLQRVRQAYDEFARPRRLVAQLSILPALGVALWLRRYRLLFGAALLCVLAAECGRRKSNGARYFPATASLAAPLWVLERAICAWVAVYIRVAHGGVKYAGTRILHAATERGLGRRAA